MSKPQESHNALPYTICGTHLKFSPWRGLCVLRRASIISVGISRFPIYSKSRNALKASKEILSILVIINQCHTGLKKMKLRTTYDKKDPLHLPPHNPNAIAVT